MLFTLFIEPKIAIGEFVRVFNQYIIGVVQISL